MIFGLPRFNGTLIHMYLHYNITMYSSVQYIGYVFLLHVMGRWFNNSYIG